ncbi:MAG: hypothetical protein V4850_23475 [Myxococcota bacterium]
MADLPEAMQPPGFRTEEEREAVATIAGFCYQVDQTIHHWLQLADDQRLFLEGGEDIDVIAPALSGVAFDEDRLVTQVKRLSGTITLRSVSAISAVAHLAGHRHRNPNVHVHMNFLTTAQAGQERPNPFSPPRRALLRWNELGGEGADLTEDAADLATIQGLLASAEQPKKGVSDEDWKVFRALLEADPVVGVVPLLRGLRWNLDAKDSKELAEGSRRRLVERGLCADSSAAELAYDSLFVHVFRLLSGDGDREVDSADLTLRVQRSDLQADRAAAATIRTRLQHLELRVARIEERIDLHEQRIGDHDHLIAILAALVSPGDSPEVAAPSSSADLKQAEIASRHAVGRLLLRLGPALRTAPPPSLDPPAESPLVVPRPIAEQAIGQALATNPWLHLWGSIRTGKTNLARRVATMDGTRVLWLRLRGAADPVLSFRSATWSEAAGGESPASTMARLLGNDAVLVLDDIPDVVSDFAALVSELVRSLQPGARLVTTGTLRLPASVIEGEAAFEVRAPRFTSEDARTLLHARAAPAEVLANGVLLTHLLAVTDGHPERLNQCISVLASQGWTFDLASMKAIFAPGEDARQRAFVLRQVTGTVADPVARELLFRLCIPRTPFSHEDVREIALVEPIVRHAGALQSQLDGLWLEMEGDSRWSVSPAVEPFGPAELQEATRNGVHQTLARRYLGRGSLTPIQAGWVMHHFESSDDADSAGVVLVQYLNALVSDGAVALDPGLSSRWPNGLPVRMRPDVRILVRAMQVRVEHARGVVPEKAIGALRAEVARGAAGWALLGAALVAHEAVSTVDPNEGARLLASGAAGAVGTLEQLRSLELCVRLHMAHVTRPEHVNSWVDLLALLPDSVRAKWAGEGEFAILARGTVNRLWSEELERPASERAWAPIQAALDSLATAGRRLRLPVLTACAISGQITVRAEQLFDVEGAVSLGDEALAELAPGAAHAIVEDMVGRQLVYADRATEGVQRLERALQEYPGAPPLALDRFQALSALVIGYGQLDLAKAVGAASTAVALARNGPPWIPPLELVSALGELAIAKWRDGGAIGAWPAMDEAAEVLLSQQRRDLRWRDRFVVFGHVSGYLTSLAITGSPPPRTVDGESYAPPRQGMFFTWVKGRPSLFQERVTALLPMQLMGFALAADDVPRGLVWAHRARELAAEAGLGHMGAQVEQLLATQRFVEGDALGGLVGLQRSILALEEVRRRERSGDGFWAPGPVPTADSLEADRRGAHVQWLSRVAIFPVAVALLLSASDRFSAAAEELSKFYAQLQRLVGPDELAHDVEELLAGAAQPASAARKVLEANAAAFPAGVDPSRWAVAHLLLCREEFGEQPRARLVHQVRFARAVERMAGELRHCYRLAIEPHFVSYWADFVRRCPFAIRSPGLVSAELQRVAGGPAEHRLRHTLLLLCDALDVRLDAGMRAWMRVGGDG